MSHSTTPGSSRPGRVQRRHAHGGVDAAAVVQGTEAGAGTKVGHDHPASRQRRRDLRQPPGNELVADAVEAVALRSDVAGQRHRLGQVAHRRVETRVEAGHLRQARPRLRHSPDRGQIVRLVQRCQGHECLEFGEHRVVDANRLRAIAAMHDPVAHGGDRPGAVMRVDPYQQLVQAGSFDAVGPGLVGVAGLQLAVGDLTVQHGLRTRLERSELKAAATRVQR
jgi:hypothetical protein